MAFWIGQLIGSFIAAILVPLFLFHFASRDGRSPHSALALRIAAVLVAVLATATTAAGSGGQFPAGAILAVVVCFVWAIRATLRDRGERLNGWQRLGVIATVVWFPVGFFGTVALYVDVQTAPVTALYSSCESAVDQAQVDRQQRAAQSFQAAEDRETQIEMALAKAAADTGNPGDTAALRLALTQQQQRIHSMQSNPPSGAHWHQDESKCESAFSSGYAAAVTGRWWAGLYGALLPLALLWGLAWLFVRLFRWVRAGFTQQETGQQP